MISRSVKEATKKGLRRLFVNGQKMGVSILPKHFYSQVPDISALSRSEHWRPALDMVGVAGADVDRQAELVRDLLTPELVEKLPAMNVHASAVAENGQGDGYGPIEAELLYAFIKAYRPGKILQIGCGVATSIMLRAAADAGYTPTITCVEPFPSPYLLRLAEEAEIRLRVEGAQATPLPLFLELDAGDLLFVDSTHTVKAGSEVNRIILDVLPRLTMETWIHFHDIYFPYDYGRDVLSGDLFFWSESTLLQAFLINNKHCKIAIAMSILHYHKPDFLKDHFKNYDPQDNIHGLRGPGGQHFPSALYLRTV